MIPGEFTGGWVRDGIAVGGGAPGEDQTVWWLQAPSRHADLRLPDDGRADVSCFTGTTTWDGYALTWLHELDLAPSGRPDVGLVEWDGADLLESGSFVADGRRICYVERWRRLPDSSGPQWALSTATARLVRAGRYCLVVSDERPTAGDFTATAWTLDGSGWTLHHAWPADATGSIAPPPPLTLADAGGSQVDEVAEPRADALPERRAG